MRKHRLGRKTRLGVMKIATYKNSAFKRSINSHRMHLSAKTLSIAIQSMEAVNVKGEQVIDFADALKEMRKALAVELASVADGQAKPGEVKK